MTIKEERKLKRFIKNIIKETIDNESFSYPATIWTEDDVDDYRKMSPDERRWIDKIQQRHKENGDLDFFARSKHKGNLCCSTTDKRIAKLRENNNGSPTEEEIALRILGMPFRKFYRNCAKATFMSPREEALLQQYRKELKKYGLYEANHKHRYIDYFVDTDPDNEFYDDYEYDFGNFNDYISPDDVNVSKAKHKALTDMMSDFKNREKDYDCYCGYNSYYNDVHPLFKTPQKMSLHYKPKTNN